MPQSLSRVLIHRRCSAQRTAPFLIAIGPNLNCTGISAGVLKGVDCPTLQAGGVDDHVHLLFGLSCMRSTSEVVGDGENQLFQSGSETKGAPFVGFHWQAGYGAFSVSQSEAETVVTYIKNQARHHQKMTFHRRIPALSGTPSGGLRRALCPGLRFVPALQAGNRF